MRPPNLGVWVEKGSVRKRRRRPRPWLGWVGALPGLAKRSWGETGFKGSFDRAGEHGEV